MRVIKWLLLFGIAFTMAWILIFTFTQEPFRESASARIFSYNAPSIPIYFYVLTAFGFGLLAGLFATIYYYIILSSRLHHKNKTIKALEAQIATQMPIVNENATAQASNAGGQSQKNHKDHATEAKELPPENTEQL